MSRQMWPMGVGGEACLSAYFYTKCTTSGYLDLHDLLALESDWFVAS